VCSPSPASSTTSRSSFVAKVMLSKPVCSTSPTAAIEMRPVSEVELACEMRKTPPYAPGRVLEVLVSPVSVK